MNEKNEKIESASRADLHCHSTASAVSKLGVQRSLGLPECATPPDEVYELAKRRGMDFVTITDHDTIAGALELVSEHDDAFVSEELTTWFRGEPQAVHVLTYGITPEDHEWLQQQRRRRRGGRRVPARERDHVRAGAPLLRRRGAAHRAPPPPARRALPDLGGPQRLAGPRAERPRRGLHRDARRHRHRRDRRPRRHRHRPDVDRDARRAQTWQEFLAHIRSGDAAACGDQGSAAKWTHAAMALAVRTLGADAATAKPDPAAVMKMVERVMREGNVRGGRDGLGPRPGRRPQPPARLAGRPRPRHDGRGAARLDAVRRLLARGPLPHRAPEA